MKHYKEKERERQQMLIKNSSIFNGTSGEGIFRGEKRPFVLTNGEKNLYAPILNDTLAYFKENNIKWWGGSKPTGHILSSQIACLNHLFAIRKDAESVLALLNNIQNEFTEILPVPSDKTPTYIAFETVSNTDHLNEGISTRGRNCTSIDALFYAKHKTGTRWIILIEWKYTEHYDNRNKSKENRKGEPKGANGMGNERMRRYNNLITASKQLKTLDDYAESLYYYEPFYQLMRQTLWAEKMIENKDNEQLKADNYLHVHVIPSENDELLQKKYVISKENMETSWRSMLKNGNKYVIVSPENLLSPIKKKYADLTNYLTIRYWNH